ncbi:MAG: porin [Burkholderiales bacterium]|nr:porin [Burkholderiales bacterium]MDE1925831.1 porin [Burkholderiales bacterium]
MKKSMTLALALLSFSGLASAQSSVTVFGVVDIPVSRYTVSGGQRWTGEGMSGLGNSRLGFRGSEDLGGGMRASFWLEGGFNPPDGTAGSGFAFTRRSTLSLTGSWGEIRLGRDYTPKFLIDGWFDPFWGTGIGEQVIMIAGTTGTSPGRQQWATGFGANYPTSLRSSNMIGYFLPGGLGGFYGQFQFAPAEQTAPGSKQGQFMGTLLGYRSGPLNVSMGYNKTMGANPVTAAAPTITTVNLASTYKFSFGTLFDELSYETYARPTSKNTSRGYLVGFIAPVGALDLKASYSTVRIDLGGTPTASKVALGFVYNLSKSTALYGTAASTRNQSGALLTVSPYVTGIANATSSGYEAGINKRF